MPQPTSNRLVTEAALSTALAGFTPSGGGTVPTLANLPAGTMVARKHDGTSYPVRGSTRADLIFHWIGPSAPLLNSTYALTNVDIFTAVVA